MAEKTISVNALPAKTYRYLKVNDSALAVPEGVTQFQDAWALPAAVVEPPSSSYNSQGGKGVGITLSRVPFVELPEKLRTIPTGMGEAVDALYAERGIESAVLEVESFGAEIMLPVEVSCGMSALSSLAIHVKRAGEALVILDIKGGDAGCAAAKSFFGLCVKVLLELGATLHLIAVQRLGNRVSHFLDVGALCEEGILDMTTLTLSGGATHLGARATLQGDHSLFRCESGYYCRGGETLDMNFVADHRGKQTDSIMKFRGVLADQAKKTFRGTIDFKQGSAGSTGDEQEDTLLLSSDVVNKAVPVILCAEEDVEGRHGVTIGQLSEEMLFYMRSRGYSEEDARRLIVQARLKSVARTLYDEKLKWEVEQWIEREIL